MKNATSFMFSVYVTFVDFFVQPWFIYLFSSTPIFITWQ